MRTDMNVKLHFSFQLLKLDYENQTKTHLRRLSPLDEMGFSNSIVYMFNLHAHLTNDLSLMHKILINMVLEMEYRAYQNVSKHTKLKALEG